MPPTPAPRPALRIEGLHLTKCACRFVSRLIPTLPQPLFGPTRMRLCAYPSDDNAYERMFKDWLPTVFGTLGIFAANYKTYLTDRMRRREDFLANPTHAPSKLLGGLIGNSGYPMAEFPRYLFDGHHFPSSANHIRLHGDTATSCFTYISYLWRSPRPVCRPGQLADADIAYLDYIEELAALNAAYHPPAGGVAANVPTQPMLMMAATPAT